MHLVDEATASALVTIDDALEAVEAAFRALDDGDVALFPVVMATAGAHGEVMGIKGGRLRRPGCALVGLKVGSYWPANRAHGLPAHGSITLLLDPDTGFPRALVAAAALNALRTAASDGVAIRALSRPSSTTLALLGAGHQAWFELRAACAVRPIARVRVWNRTSAHAETLARRARDELGLDAEAADVESALRGADIVITATAAGAPLFDAAWIRPGTHVSAMGADAHGKQELPVRLVAGAQCFADVVAQAIEVGELRAAHAAGLLPEARITAIGTVLNGRAPGRADEASITVYDSSGTALQDLAIAELALQRALARGLARDAGRFRPTP